MKKRLLAIAFATPWICLVAWTLWLAALRSGGAEITLPITGYDPRDLLSGHYIAYQIDWERADCQVFPGGICPKKAFCTEGLWGQECRFYIPETDAAYLDDLFRRNTDKLSFQVLYSYRFGRPPMAKELLINHTDWKTYLKQHPHYIEEK